VTDRRTGTSPRRVERSPRFYFLLKKLFPLAFPLLARGRERTLFFFLRDMAPPLAIADPLVPDTNYRPAPSGAFRRPVLLHVPLPSEEVYVFRFARGENLSTFFLGWGGVRPLCLRP